MTNTTTEESMECNNQFEPGNSSLTQLFFLMGHFLIKLYFVGLFVFQLFQITLMVPYATAWTFHIENFVVFVAGPNIVSNIHGVLLYSK